MVGNEDEEKAEAAVPKKEKKVIIFWIIHTHFYLGTAWLVGDDEEEDEVAVPKREKKVIIFWIIHTQFYLDTAWLVGDEGCWDPLPWWKNLHLAGKIFLFKFVFEIYLLTISWRQEDEKEGERR